MQALCVRLAVSDAIIAYLSGYIRSFFPRQVLPGNTWYELAIYILIYYVFFFFLFGQPEKAELLSTVYLYYLYIVLFNWFYEVLATVTYLIRKDRKTLSISFYYTIHFILIVFFSDTHVHTRLSSSL